MTLSPKYERFVAEFLKDLNATKAAQRAGYSKKTAYAQGSRLLKVAEVAAAIEAGKKKRARRMEVTQDRVLREIASIAFANTADVIEVDDEGNVSVKPLNTLRPRDQRAIESIQQTKSERLAPDSGVLETVTLKVKMHSKVSALRMLMDHLGMDAPKRVESGEPGEFKKLEQMSEAELEAYVKAREQAAGGGI